MGQNQAGFQLGFGNRELLTDVEVHGNNEPSNLSNQEESVHLDGVEEVDHVVGVLERWTCKGCAAVFHSLDQQRAHFKSDFHRFNMKRRLAGKEAVTEDEFEAIVQGRGEQNDDDLSSISGSDAESSAEEATDDHSGPKGHPLQQGSRKNCILVTFPVSGQRLLIWRCLIAADKEVLQWERGFTDTETSRQRLSVKEEECLRRLRCLTAGALPGKRPLWVILLAAGGHFAGLVVDSQGGSVLAHKTFHRYVVRAKAGGRQTTHDATGRAPKSAGASLRRYNEQALQEEIRKLLANWSEYLRAASHLFVHAPSSNSQAIFGGEPALLNHSDHRIHRIPFTTRRPTMKEAKRICHLLGTIYYVREGSADLGTEASVDIDAAAAVGIRSLSNASNVLLESEKTGKSIKAKLPKGKLNDVTSSASAVAVTSVPVAADEDPATYMTPLHEAARDGNSDKVLELLEEGADPCIQETGGRTPYAVAKDKVTRNVFRRFMATHPDMWDWHAADVPSPLTDELEATQAAKQAEKDAKRKAREKERKKLRKVQEAQEKARQVKTYFQPYTCFQKLAMVNLFRQNTIPDCVLFYKH